jgi:hypothetical protein
MAVWNRYTARVSFATTFAKASVVKESFSFQRKLRRKRVPFFASRSLVAYAPKLQRRSGEGRCSEPLSR